MTTDDNQIQLKDTIISASINEPVNDEFILENESDFEIRTRFSSKLTRYNIGIVSLLAYLITSVITYILYKYRNSDLKKLDPFSETFYQFSFLILFLFLSFFFTKYASRKTFNFVNLLKYYEPEWKKDISKIDFQNISSTFYIFEGTEELFKKNIHKMSFAFMILTYFSITFFNKATQIQLKSKDNTITVIPLLYTISSMVIIISLRKSFLNAQKFAKSDVMSLSIILAGIIFLFILQILLYRHVDQSALVYVYSIFGGVFFGFFSVFLKYSYNLFSNHFNIILMFGYIGLYNIIAIPLVLCIKSMSGNDSNIFKIYNIGFWIIKFIVEIIRYISIFHCVLGLGPLFFGTGMLFEAIINLILNISLGNFDTINKKTRSCLFIVGLILSIIGVGFGLFGKFYKKRYLLNYREQNDIINSVEEISFRKES